MADETDLNIHGHVLVPKHVKLSDEEAENLLKKFNISKKQLPKIKKKDAAIANMDTVAGDIIQITRDSPTSKGTPFYRVVV